MSVSERIVEMMDNLKISKIELSRQLDVTHSTVSNWVRSGGNVRSDLLEKLLEIYPNLSAEWLLRGKGKMFDTPKKPCKEQLEAEKEKIQLLKKLNDSLERENIQLRKSLKMYEEKGYSLTIEPPPEYSRKKSEK